MDITCGRCGTLYHADEAHVGKRLKCTSCGTVIAIEHLRRTDLNGVSSGYAKRPVQSKPRVSAIRHVYLWGSLSVILLVVIFSVKSRPHHAASVDRPNGANAYHADTLNEQQRITNASPSQKPVPNNPFGDHDGNNPFAETNSINSLMPQLETRPKQYHSLPTGERLIEDVGVYGRGELSVSNQTNLDAVVRLYNQATLETVRWFFVKAKTSCTVGGIPEGIYALAYTSGLDWVDSDEYFRWNPSYYEFEASLHYSEQWNESGVHYHEYSVTLHPVIGGNARTKSVSRSDFLKGHKRISR